MSSSGWQSPIKMPSWKAWFNETKWSSSETEEVQPLLGEKVAMKITIKGGRKYFKLIQIVTRYKDKTLLLITHNRKLQKVLKHWTFWGQCYKNIYEWKLPIFIIS